MAPFFPMGPEPWQNLILVMLYLSHHKIRIDQRIKAAHTEIWALRWKKKEKLRNSLMTLFEAEIKLHLKPEHLQSSFLSQQAPSCLEQCGQIFCHLLFKKSCTQNLREVKLKGCQAPAMIWPGSLQSTLPLVITVPSCWCSQDEGGGQGELEEGRAVWRPGTEEGYSTRTWKV